MCKRSCSSSLYAIFLTVFILDILPPHLWDYDEGFDAVKVTDEELSDIFKYPAFDPNSEVEGYAVDCFIKSESEKRLGFEFPIISVRLRIYTPSLATMKLNIMF